MKHKHRHFGYLILIILLAILLGGSFFIPELKKFTSPTFVREYLLGFGMWSYLVFVFIFLLTIPLPIPSTPLVLTGGYLYGTTLGTILAIVAAIIGSSISFYSVRSYGRPLLEKMVDSNHIKHFNHIFKKRGIIAAFISYVIPVFPSDCVSAILGLTRIKYKTFIFVIMLGHIPRFLIINSLGEDLFTGFKTWRTLIVLLIAAAFLIIAIFREKLKKVFFKELKELEIDAEKAEQEIAGEMKIIGKKAERVEKKAKREAVKETEFIEEKIGLKQKRKKS